MPVKPSNLVLYPGGSLTSAQWLNIRNEVLERDGHCCKMCKAPNRTTVQRVKAPGIDHYIVLDTLTVHDAETGAELGQISPGSLPVGKATRIVLTIAHLDHNPSNNGKPGDRPNLAALCQRHHLWHDQEHHAEQRAKTLRARKEAEFGPELPMFG
jgi:5-methylcytosine-specific restriction endonuclease McrA